VEQQPYLSARHAGGLTLVAGRSGGIVGIPPRPPTFRLTFVSTSPTTETPATARQIASAGGCGWKRFRWAGIEWLRYNFDRRHIRKEKRKANESAACPARPLAPPRAFAGRKQDGTPKGQIWLWGVASFPDRSKVVLGGIYGRASEICDACTPVYGAPSSLPQGKTLHYKDRISRHHYPKQAVPKRQRILRSQAEVLGRMKRHALSAGFQPRK